jgi:hypothetical protein
MIFVIVVGSPRGIRSTSNSIASYLSDQFEDLGSKTRTFFVNKLIHGSEVMSEFLSVLKVADVMVLSAPLYVDSQPASVIEFMQTFSEQWTPRDNKPGFVSIFNCGFPESRHNHIALEICEAFANANSLEWFGGLPIGAGQTINGDDLVSAGPRARRIRPALDLLAKALTKGNSVPPEALAKTRKWILPLRLFGWFGRMFWRKQAKHNKVLDKLDNKPYA